MPEKNIFPEVAELVARYVREKNLHAEVAPKLAEQLQCVVEGFISGKNRPQMAERVMSLLTYIDKTVDAYSSKRAAFIKAVNEDPEHALQWAAEGTLTATIEARHFARMAKALREGKTDGIQLMCWLQDEIQRVASIIDGSRGTSTFHGLDKRVELETYALALDILRGRR